MEINKYQYAVHNHTIKFKDKKGYYTTIDLIKYPTLNCQVSTISNTKELLNCSTERVKDIPEDKTKLDLIFDKIFELSNPQILIDINDFNYHNINQMFIDRGCEIVFKQSYTSPNASNMMMILYKKP